jgi:hypothetical protein
VFLFIEILLFQNRWSEQQAKGYNSPAASARRLGPSVEQGHDARLPEVRDAGAAGLARYGK